MPNVGPIREQLLTILNRGAAVLVADLTRTGSLDYAGAEALTRVYQRAVGSGTELRLVTTAQVVRRVLAVSGLDRLVSVYPTLQAALAPAPRAAVIPLPTRPARATANRRDQAKNTQATHEQPGHAVAALNLGLLQKVADAIRDGIALADDAGILVLVNRRLEELFGYEHASLAGLPLDTLIPATLQESRPAADPAAGPPGRDTGALLAGRSKDGTMFSVLASFTPVPTTAGALTLAVIRGATGASALGAF